MQAPRETEAEPSREPPAARGAPRAFDPEALPPGARLDEFEIVRVLGAGGFGIVYLALDQLLLRYVAIKEFIPTALAGRTKQGAVAVRSADAADTFAVGLDSFYNEGRLLARFDHPSLVRVFRFWKANGTAYMAMQYYPGQTLKEARAQMPCPPDEPWLRAFVDRLLGALETLHAQGVYHRDIAPDNILLLPDGHPVILDFGSARRVISDRTQSLTAILKPNYSPVEQYADDAGMRQGAYTDLYALGGTVYFMLCGRDPIPAVMRAVRDSFPVLARSPDGPFGTASGEFLAVVDWMLGVSPDDRPKTVDEVRAALRGETLPPAPSERHGVLIGEPNQVYDGARAMAKTEVAPARLGAAPSRPVEPAPTRAPVVAEPSPFPRKLVLSGLAVTACAALA
ncbi:MAG: serine/threonine protein kinase, partial [Rhizobiales bacterium]|nr:serine/threonine protein kinase [Rhizobacter sp.]